MGTVAKHNFIICAIYLRIRTCLNVGYRWACGTCGRMRYSFKIVVGKRQHTSPVEGGDESAHMSTIKVALREI